MLSTRHACSCRGGSAARLPVSKSTTPCRHVSLSRRGFVVRAQKDEDKKDAPAGANDLIDKVREELKKGGWDKQRAKDALSKWSTLGANKDPEELRKLLLRNSVKPLTGLGIQLVLDLAACIGGYLTAQAIASAGPFPGDIAIQFVGYFIACYYFLQVSFDSFAAVTILFAVVRFNANPDVYLAAVQELAGPGVGLGVIGRAQRAVNTARVFQLLNEVFELLKAKSIELGPGSTLDNLATYLTLVNAIEKFGFDPAKYGLTDKKAAEIAAVFNKYDKNEDGKLELSELRTLCQALGKDLDDDELREAIKLLDTNQNGVVEFNEFVGWWVKGQDMVQPAPVSP